ncbi:hypothetical protein AMATHDRAFT_95 [Amanita thiersii Skay4041]|uniref:Uncharacterized protein n=1 Tax=Amanita thiersii Skay4041 TaxID=703135 RepID=A0A2A9P0K0_9AGAR|nr:hypothetical protein AMATHDRAFT_95 [Amanita thiersii Skay4041]
MFIPRTSDGNIPCSSDSSSCNPKITIVNPDPTVQEDGNTMGPPDFEKPGPHRYIGVGMVLGILVIILVLWIWIGKWPRQKLDALCCGRRRQRQQQEAHKQMIIDFTAEPPELEKPKGVHMREGEEQGEREPRTKGVRGAETPYGYMPSWQSPERDRRVQGYEVQAKTHPHKVRHSKTYRLDDRTIQ